MIWRRLLQNAELISDLIYAVATLSLLIFPPLPYAYHSLSFPDYELSSVLYLALPASAGLGCRILGWRDTSPSGTLSAALGGGIFDVIFSFSALTFAFFYGRSVFFLGSLPEIPFGPIELLILTGVAVVAAYAIQLSIVEVLTGSAGHLKVLLTKTYISQFTLVLLSLVAITSIFLVERRFGRLPDVPTNTLWLLAVQRVLRWQLRL